MLAELWALRDGLIMVKNLNISKLLVEMDSQVAVELVWGRYSSTNMELTPILIDCRQLVQSFEECSGAHIYREANFCADAMASLGISIRDFFEYFDDPPREVLLPMLRDRLNVNYHRRVRAMP
jgi:hypothetical protein